ncbi:MAG: serine/threonine-protein kinase [Iamia sp.]
MRSTRDRRPFEARLQALRALGPEPGLDPILDGGVASGRGWWVTPAGGRSLDQDRPGSLAEAIAVGVGLATALGRVHAAGLVHGRVALDTVQLVATGARLELNPVPPVAPMAPGDGSARPHVPPEVLEGQPWTPPGDLWALGSVLYQLIEGDPPFAREAARGALEVLMAVTLGGSVTFHRPDVDEGLRRALLRALDADPAHRPTASAFGAVLVTTTGAPLASRLDTVTPGGVEAPDLDDPATGSEVGRPLGSGYLLTEPLGRGAMGRVWRGVRRSDGTAMAVKVLRPELADDPEQVARFLAERNALRAVVDDRVVRVHDLVVEGSVLAIVMDLVDGGDLRTAMGSEGPISPGRAATLLAGVAGGLAAVHRAGIVHRDVKPENVLMTAGEPPVRLTDFGVARIVDGATLTRPTQLIGTPDYVAPELVAGRQPSPAADIYALGIMTYEVLVGRRPFVGPTQAAVLRAHLDEPPMPPPDIAPALWQVLAACLAKDPERRPSAEEVAERLNRLAPTLAGAPPMARLPAPPEPVFAPAAAPASSGFDPQAAPAVPAPAPLALAGPGDDGDGRLETRAGRRPQSAPPEQEAAGGRRWPWVVALAVLLLVVVAAGFVTSRRDDDPTAGSADDPAAREGQVEIGYVALPIEVAASGEGGRVAVTYAAPVGSDADTQLVLQIVADADQPQEASQVEFDAVGGASSGSGGAVLTLDDDEDGLNDIVTFDPAAFDLDVEVAPEACVWVFLPYRDTAPEPADIGLDAFASDCARIAG